MSQAGERYRNKFAQLNADNQGAFIPFVTLGDPGIEQSFNIIKTLIDAGADALELGIPFSDPSADGVTIQASAERALAAGVNTDDCFALLKRIRDYDQSIPIGLLLYGNLVFARGVEQFYRDAADAGVDSILVADVPVRESSRFRQAAYTANVAPIFIAPPNASDETLREVASFGRGYTYVLGRAGVTGTETEMQRPNETLIKTLNLYHAAPGIVGFGISAPEHVKLAIEAGAAGAISGSATVKIIQQHLANPTEMLAKLAEFVKAMKAATIGVTA